ncbi:MAG TPA: BamA/TamA family outer membrane protein [Puia sp.]|nr:BamA/TamA family outer membrane protein [Puia sp.]
MGYRRQVSISLLHLLIASAASLFLWSCSGFHHVSGYQYGKPFVFHTNIKVEGNISHGEKKDLALRLANQLDDSLRTQETSIAGVYTRIVNPPAYDSNNMRRSINFMVILLNASGYYTPVIKDTVRIDTIRKKNHIKDQYRVTVDFTVWPGKQLRLDSVGFDLHTPALQALALQTKGQSFLKKGQPYSNRLISDERDRLVTLFHENGYYEFTKDDIVAVIDTVAAALIDPTLDPFEQAALLEKLQKKRENPTINVVMEQRPPKDSGHLRPYYIGNVTVYPDLQMLEDTATINGADTTTARGLTIISRSDKFKPSFIANNVYLRPGRLYRQSNADRTFNRFSQMSAWQQAAISFTPSGTSDSLLDAAVRLYPNKKQHLQVGVEASRNTADIITVGNLFGVGVNFALQNRNTFRQSVLSTTNLRAGVELGDDFIQTTQASIAHTISVPRLIAPEFIKRWLVRREGRLDSLRSVLNVNASYTDRRQFFTAQSINTSWGYQWTKGNRSYLFNLINVEYTKLFKTDSFQKLLDSFPSLNLAFRSGLVVGMQFVYSSVRKKGIHTNFLRISAEESGALLGTISALDKGDLWRFVKGEVEYSHHIDFKRTELAMRAYAGGGIAYGRAGQGYEETLPFYKAFFAGGPNSMRGWQIRQLGLGSSTFYTTQPKQLDRFGDIQLEGNIEYRFPLATLFTVKIKSALFADAGNIWNRQLTDTANPKRDMGSDFQLNRFYKEFAVDAGTGLRLDFDYFLIRFDWAYKLRDPQRLENADKWFYKMRLGDGQFQLGINYPF